MKLTSLDLKDNIINDIAISVGYTTNKNNNKSIHDGLLHTKQLTLSDVKHCAKIDEYELNKIHLTGTPYRFDNKVYMCVYSPMRISTVAPTQTLNMNIINDDVYVWRYVCTIDEVIDNDYITLEAITEYPVYGACATVNEIVDSNYSLDDYVDDVIHIHTTYLSGTGATFVVENDQDTNMISDILVQNGGQDYDDKDILLVTDSSLGTGAKVNLSIVNGEVTVENFDNGSGYPYMDIILIGDGQGASLNFKMLAGVLTECTIEDGGEDYTWCEAIIVNSERYNISSVKIEPLNGYKSDIGFNLGVNKYIIRKTFNITDKINFYTIHNKPTIDKLIQTHKIAFFDEFTPQNSETISLQFILE